MAQETEFVVSCVFVVSEAVHGAAWGLHGAVMQALHGAWIQLEPF